MNGNFETRQNLTNHDETVGSRGWLEWEAGDESCEITITVVARNGASGNSRTFTHRRGSEQRERWRADVGPATRPPWVRGGATGSATAWTTKADGAHIDDSWSNETLTLQ